MLVLLLTILRYYSHRIYDGVYLCHDIPVVYWLPWVRSKLLDLEGALNEVCKGVDCVQYLFDMHLVLGDHEVIDQALPNCVSQEILCPRLLKSMMEVLHPGDISRV